MDKEIDEILDEAKMAHANEGDFIGEIWKSTDGKHTVHGKATTSKGRENMRVWVNNVYDLIKETEGTKQAQVVKEYAKAEAEVNSSLGACGKCGAPNTKYSTGRVGCSKFCWKK